MRRIVTAALALAFFLGLPSSSSADEKAIERELKRDQGTWQFVSLVVDGRKTDEETLKDWRLVIKGEKWTFRQGEKVLFQGTYKIVEVDGKVRRTVVTVTEGMAEKQTTRGISEVTGDMRKGCLAKQGAERPTAFSSATGSGHVLVTYKRVRP